jgi:zinc/manganese transport system substrate-binding protein
MKPFIFTLIIFFSLPLYAATPLNIIATTSSMGLLARVVGAEQAQVKVLSPPDRDAHFIQARPSMIKDLRNADVVIAVGADLEIGWLPLALERSTNRRVQPRQSGYFEAAAQVPLLGAGTPADRALGDVHPGGNPHVNLDPQHMAALAHALALHLAGLDNTHEALYQARAQAFSATIEKRMADWQTQLANAPGVIMHHQDADYLLQRFGVPILGYIEAVPGIPPSAAHLQDLHQRLKTKTPPGVIIRARFHPPQGADFLARALAWQAYALPLEPPLDSGVAEYLHLIDEWVSALRGDAQP